MKTIKEIFTLLFCIFMILLIFATALSPIIISALTGDWGYLFLFFVVGVPMIGEWLFMLLILDLFTN